MAYRNAYRLRAGWDDIEGFGTMRFGAVIPVATVILSASMIEGHDGAPVSAQLRGKVEAVADRRLQLGVFVKDRSEGPFAELLAPHRPDLAAPSAG